jgi:hypothetical protein
MTDHEVAETLRAASARLAPAQWKLKRLLAELPAGATRDAVEAAGMRLDQAQAALDHEASVLAREPAE